MNLRTRSPAIPPHLALVPLMVLVGVGLACSGESGSRASGSSSGKAGEGGASSRLESGPGPTPDATGDRILVAHRGASAYAPEHTLAAYRLAVEQGADYIEPDLQITRDGVLIALHDLTLERTTDVEQVYPDRYREESAPSMPGRGDTRPDSSHVEGDDTGGGAGGEMDTVRRWYASDFTLAEIRKLDAGSWFGEEFRGSRIPTLDEVIAVALEGEVGIFPETKAPDIYGNLGFEMERLLLETLEKHGLQELDLAAPTPVVIQSFSPESLRILRENLETELPLTLLVSAPDEGGWLTAEGLERASTFATAIGPSKSLILEDPSIVRRAHESGLSVIPYTFRSDRTGEFSSGAAEMSHFIYELGVDGLFTNNPDHFPRSPPS